MVVEAVVVAMQQDKWKLKADVLQLDYQRGGGLMQPPVRS